MKKIYLLALTLFSLTTFAQTYNYTVYNPSNSGIVSNSINSIKTDTNGVLWMATYYGVSTFNGTAFTNYTTSNSAIPTNAIVEVEIDNLNRKWMATQFNGIVLYNGTTWTNYTTANSGLPSNSIVDIAVDSANNLWIGTSSGLTKFNGTTWTTYSALTNLNSIAIDSSNGVWVTNNFGVLYKFNGTDFNGVFQGLSKILKITNTTIYCDSGDGLMTFTTSGTYLGTQYQSNSCLSGYQFNTLNVDSNNKVWIGFDGTGLQNFTDCTTYTSSNSGLSDNFITAIQFQTANTIWVGTLEGGLVKMTHNTAGQCFQKISSGDFHNVAIKSDGTLWAWGVNNYGQLGNGNTTDRIVPTQIGTATNWQSISAARNSTYAIKTDGSLWVWGYNDFGQLGDGTLINRNVPTRIGTANNWRSIEAGGNHTLALKTDGTLWAWGYNGIGQLGDGTTIDKIVPTLIGTATNWQSIATGELHSLALKSNGSLWAWGFNSSGQLGIGTSSNGSSVPIQVGNETNWEQIAAGGDFSIGKKTNGILCTWGINYFGQLGDGTTIDKLEPTAVFDQIQSIAAGNYHTLVTTTNGSLYAWGRNGDGQLGDGTQIERHSPTPIGTATNWQVATGGNQHSMAIKSDGSISVFGYNGNGQLGIGNSTVFVTTPTPIGCPTSNLANEDFVISNEVKAYPNPVKDILHISYETTITAAVIYTILGQEVLHTIINANQGTIDVSKLTSGTFFVKITSDNKVKTINVIKE